MDRRPRFWTTDMSTALLTAAVRAGVVWMNKYKRDNATVRLAGYRESGFRGDQSLHALDNYTQLKTTWIALLADGSRAGVMEARE